MYAICRQLLYCQNVKIDPLIFSKISNYLSLGGISSYVFLLDNFGRFSISPYMTLSISIYLIRGNREFEIINKGSIQRYTIKVVEYFSLIESMLCGQ